MGSNRCACFIIPVFNKKKMLMREGVSESSSFLPSLLLFLYFHFFFFEKRISRRLQGQKPQVLGAFLWGILCTLFCEELGTKAALLSSASRLCQNLNAQSNGRMYP